MGKGAGLLSFNCSTQLCECHVHKTCKQQFQKMKLFSMLHDTINILFDLFSQENMQTYRISIRYDSLTLFLLLYSFVMCQFHRPFECHTIHIYKVSSISLAHSRGNFPALPLSFYPSLSIYLPISFSLSLPFPGSLFT